MSYDLEKLPRTYNPHAEVGGTYRVSAIVRNDIVGLRLDRDFEQQIVLRISKHWPPQKEYFPMKPHLTQVVENVVYIGACEVQLLGLALRYRLVLHH